MTRGNWRREKSKKKRERRRKRMQRLQKTTTTQHTGGEGERNAHNETSSITESCAATARPSSAPGRHIHRPSAKRRNASCQWQRVSAPLRPLRAAATLRS